MDYPHFKLILSPDQQDLGMKLMSMVDKPAIMVNWVKFKEQSEIKFLIQNEDQRIVFAPALIPDLPIKRILGEEIFYVSIDRANILQTAIKFSKDNLANRLDTNHDEQVLSGITIFESFVTDENRVTMAKGFEDLPIGTWFITAKVNNDAVWAKIKSGELNGFSIDALFKFEQTDAIDNKALADITRSILSTL